MTEQTMSTLSQHWGMMDEKKEKVPFSPYCVMPEVFGATFVDPHEYEKSLDLILKGITYELKTLSSEYVPRVNKTLRKHHDLVYGAGLSRKGCKKEIASLKESIQLINSLKEQYPKLLEKGIVKFPQLRDSLVGKATKELFESYINFTNTAALPIEGTLQPYVDTLGASLPWNTSGLLSL